MRAKNREAVPAIEYHADDYGLFETQSRRILDCHEHGVLNGVSVMPNSENLRQCMEMLEPYREEIALCVHVNLIEGHSLSPREEVPLLTDAQGRLTCSFGNLLVQSFLPKRKIYQAQLKKELRAQIAAVRAFIEPDQPLRFDGHAHYSMLPVVFDALMEVIREDQIPVSYLRIPKEYVSLYLKHWKEIRHFPVINLAKVLILNLLAARNQRKYGAFLETLEKRVFLGVFLSGRMYRQNVEAILPEAMALANKLGCGVEVLAHPGGVFEEADIAKLTNRDDIHFLTSDFRRKEAAMFLEQQRLSKV